MALLHLSVQNFFPHARSTSTSSCRPPMSWHGCSVPEVELLAGSPGEPVPCFSGGKLSPAFGITARPLHLCSLPPPARILPGLRYHLDSCYHRDQDLLINSGSLCWDRAQNTGRGGVCLQDRVTSLPGFWLFFP